MVGQLEGFLLALGEEDGTLLRHALAVARPLSGPRSRVVRAIHDGAIRGSGYPDFHVSWVAFLTPPKLTQFGEYVRDAARGDPVVYGLWRDILFGSLGLARQAMSREVVRRHMSDVRDGRATRLWPEAGREAAELLVYLYLHPRCRVGTPPEEWDGAYAALRARFPDVVARAPSAVGATKKIVHYLRAACRWGTNEKSAARCGRQVRAALECGLLTLETEGRVRSWEDPRSAHRLEEHRARWRADADGAARMTVTRSDAAPSNSASLFTPVPSPFSDEVLRRLGFDEVAIRVLGLRPPGEVARAVVDAATRLDVARHSRRQNKAKKIAAGVMQRTGASAPVIGRALGAPPKAVDAWLRECLRDPILAASVAEITPRITSSPRDSAVQAAPVPARQRRQKPTTEHS